MARSRRARNDADVTAILARDYTGELIRITHGRGPVWREFFQTMTRLVREAEADAEVR